MKATKEELIDFFLFTQPKCDREWAEKFVNSYFKYKSINSNEPDELRAVGKHEQKKKFCRWCSIDGTDPSFCQH